MRLKLTQQTLYYKYMQARYLSDFRRSKYLANPAAKNEKVNFQVGEGIFVADRAKKAEVIATNEMDDGVYATPAVCDDCLYVRTHSALYAFKESQQ